MREVEFNRKRVVRIVVRSDAFASEELTFERDGVRVDLIGESDLVAISIQR